MRSRLFLVTPENAAALSPRERERVPKVRAKPTAPIHEHERQMNIALQNKGLKPGRDANMDLIRATLKKSGGK